MRSLKELLEQQFAGCQSQTTQRILQVSNGFSYTWKASAPACAKVTDVRLMRKDLAVVPPALHRRLSNEVKSYTMAFWKVIQFKSPPHPYHMKFLINASSPLSPYYLKPSHTKIQSPSHKFIHRSTNGISYKH